MALAWLALACAHAENVPVAQCIERVALERGTSCGKPDSYTVKLRNRCEEQINMRFCLRRKNGTWDCGMYSGAAKGKGTSYFVCEGTGELWLAAQLTGNRERMPHPEDGFAKATASSREEACTSLEEMTGKAGGCECSDIAPGKVRCLAPAGRKPDVSLLTKARTKMRERAEADHEERCRLKPQASECQPRRNGGSGVRD
jgi:hypothetical protein